MYSVVDLLNDDLVGLTDEFDVAVSYAEYLAAELHAGFAVLNESLVIVYVFCAV
jgi:hypothetical protein